MHRVIFVLLFVAAFCGVTVPSVAHAAGRLVKGTLAAVYYVADDGKRYVFPNERLFFSWYEDFSQVETISDDELATYQIGGNVRYRPGTRLVKIQSVPKVYAVEPGGVLRWIESESAARELYGDAWAARVDDVIDAYFTSYTEGESLADGPYPDGTLLLDEATGSYYLVWNEQRRLVTQDGLMANRFRTQDAIVLDTSDLEDGDQIAAEDSAFSDAAELSHGDRQSAGVVVEVGRNPEHAFQGGSDEVIAVYTFSFRETTTMTDPVVRISAESNEDSDFDAGGLVRGDGVEQIEAAFTRLRFLDESGEQVFGTAGLRTGEDEDGAQDLRFAGSHAFAPGRHTLRLAADVADDATEHEEYSTTLFVSQTEFEAGDDPTDDVTPESLSSSTVTVEAEALQLDVADSSEDAFALRGNTGPYEAIRFTFENPTSEPAYITDLVLTGFIDENEGEADYLEGADEDEGSFTTVNDVLTSVSLVRVSDGTTLALTTNVPSSGKVAFNDVRFSVPADGELELAVMVEVDPSAPFEFGADRLAFDIVDEDDVLVERADGDELDVEGVNPNNGSSPTIVLTVSEQGTLTIEGNGDPDARLLMGSTNNTAYQFTFSATQEEDIVIDTVTVRLRDTADQGSVKQVKLQWTEESGSEMSRSVGMTNGNATFEGLGLAVPADDEVDASVLVDLNSSSTGAVSGHTVGFVFEPNTFVAVGSVSGYRYTEEDFGEAISDETEIGSEAVVRRNEPVFDLASDQPDRSQSRSRETPLLRFTVRSTGDGTAEIERLTFKVIPSDVGYETSQYQTFDNDLLEELADLNGDAQDDNSVAELVDEEHNDTIGEDSTTSLDFWMYDASEDAIDETPAGLDTGPGDYGLLVYDFGSVPLRTHTTDRLYEFSLNVEGLAAGAQTVRIELLGAGDLLWNDGSATPTTEDGTGVNDLPVRGSTISFD